MGRELWQTMAGLAAAVLVGCAAGEIDDGVDPPDGAAPVEDAAFQIPPVPDRGPAPECEAGDSRSCEAGPGCTGLQVCLGGSFGPCDTITELCNGLDDDCDGSVDEDYPGLGQACAAGRGACQTLGDNVCAENGRGVICGAVGADPGTEVCNAEDDDCDGINDEGADCPSSEAACNDGVDDDGDGKADCADEDCAGGPECQGDPEDCATPGDEDGDGRADCDDLDCAAFEACRPPAIEVCDAPGDEDGDGAADCDDPDCAGFVDCVPPPEEICDIRGDEDGDGLFDCLDDDCRGHPACGPPPDEICDVRGDEDGDGLFDCLDDDCADAPNCQAPTEICEQAGDEDGDGRADCADDDCADHPLCAPRDEICDVIGDEDRDGRADCDDEDCEGHPFCAPPEELCAQAGDEDGDGLANCADPDCAAHPACLELCDRAGDEDGDGLADCADPDCAGHPACAPPDEICDRAGDEDGDGRADCLDDDCVGHPACAPAGPEICDRIGDEDGDGRADCDDDDCAGHPFCADPVERCDVVGDEDGDGQADCDDPDCAADPRCAPPPDVVPIAAPGGVLDLEGSLDAQSPLWARPSAACAAGQPGHHYRYHRVRNQTGEPQIVDIFAVWDDDGYLHAFNDPFVPGDLAGCLGGNDDAPGIGIGASEMQLIMPAGSTVALVASTYYANDAIGDYAIEVSTLAEQRVAAPVGGRVTLSGSIDAADPVWARRVACDQPDNQVDHHYDAYEIQNPTGAAITVTATATWPGGDGYLHWFTGALPFDPAQVARCGGGNDDFNGTGGSQIAGIPVPAGGSVLIIASTFGGGATIGAYTVTVTTN